MRHHRFRPGLFAALMTLVVVPLLALAGDQGQSPDRPKLVVLVVFDQMRGDYLTKWQSLFDEDGFGRLLRDGAWYQNCHYPYAFTLTAAGHTSLVTGCPPSKHGIISNDWYDPVARAKVDSVSSDRFRNVPPLLVPTARDRSAAPLLRLQPTFSDGLEKMSKAKVVSLSIKDRAAILMAALRATAVYWFNNFRGLFVTSTFYRDEVHPWVGAFNKERPADKYFGKDWNKLKPDFDYEKYSGPDDVVGEGNGYKQGRTFPHAMNGGLAKPGEKFYDAFTFSPYASEILLELTKRAIDAEKLGQRKDQATDVLCVSFSSNDLVGHCWGPDSQEVLDITLRSDLIIKDLLNHLDAKVGAGRYLMVVTADHGVCPLPEVARAQGKDGGLVSPTLFTSQAADFLQQTFAAKMEKLPWIERFNGDWIYFNHGTLRYAGVPPAKAEQALVEWLRHQPGIQNVYGRTQLERGPLADDPIGEAMRLSYHPKRSGDIGIVLKPYYLAAGPITDINYDPYRTTHGSPHAYDTHVPLVVYGAGVQPGIRQERITPLATAAIAAHALGIPPPAGAEYPVPAGLFK